MEGTIRRLGRKSRGGPGRRPRPPPKARLFFESIVRENQRVVRLVDSDYTFLNEPLARLYDLGQTVQGVGMRRVKLEDPNRGGILGMSATLAASFSISSDLLMILRPSRNHWTAAPPTKTEPSRQYVIFPSMPQPMVVNNPFLDRTALPPVFIKMKHPVP